MKPDVGLLVLRLAGLFLAFGHGWGKVSALAAGNADRLIEGVAGLGFPAPGLFAWAAALAEFGGGLLVALGLMTRVGAAFAAFTMAVAAFLRHKAHLQLAVKLGLLSVTPDAERSWGNPELALMYLLVFLTLLVTGPGKYAVGRHFDAP